MKLLNVLGASVVGLTIFTLTSCSNSELDLNVRIHNQENWDDVFDTNRLIINLEFFIRNEINSSVDSLVLRTNSETDLRETTDDIQGRLEIVRNSDVTNTTMTGNLLQRNASFNYSGLLGNNFNVINDLLPINVEFNYNNGVNNIIVGFRRSAIIGRSNALPGNIVVRQPGSTTANLNSVGINIENFRRFATLPENTPDLRVIALNEFIIGNEFRYFIHIHVPFMFLSILTEEIRFELNMEINGIVETFMFDSRGGSFGYQVELFSTNTNRGFF